MAIIEIRRTQNESMETTEIFIGERLDDPFHRFHAARLTRLREEQTFSIGIPGLHQPATLDALRDYVALLDQTVRTAEQFEAEIAAEIAAKIAAKHKEQASHEDNHDHIDGR